MTFQPNQQDLLHTKPQRGAEVAVLISTACFGYAMHLVIPTIITATISCALLILLSSQRNPLQHRMRWWRNIGLCSGCFLGTASSMVNEINQGGEAHSPWERLTVVAILGITGFLSGHRIGFTTHQAEVRSIGDSLRSLSGTFTGIFGVLVAIHFVLHGLDEARTLASRLSTSLTVIVLSVAGPGWITYHLKKPQREQK
ncbi:hypothetical protein [Synechococcus sp. RS9916]|uniref:hypothetical protein n=1 Tax=Synechococcus sp. RS9916 TaxID=221359 RepID=UPI0000E53745|nr:hypothetical protein [Synechococcus sp. RS9916]EAU74331.1 hypothetical protein RS9916_32527 [Synechococcus sp. RS9916]